MEKYYTIGQLANLVGISTKTLRIYEQKGLLSPKRNSSNGYRLYGSDAVKALEQIQLMKYLDLPLDRIGEFLKLFENVSREKMLLEQKRMLERKRNQLNTVIAHVDRAIGECKGDEQNVDDFLKALGRVVKNQRADELALKLGAHADEPGGWSRFIFTETGIGPGQSILDAGAGYGNLWRYNAERLPENANVTCVDKHNTHMDTFCKDVAENAQLQKMLGKKLSFVWDDLETMELPQKYDRIFFNHVAYQIENRDALYRKFYNSMNEKGVFVCTWGGILFFENINRIMKNVLSEKEYDVLVSLLEKQRTRVRDLENELREVFPNVEKKTYKVNLEFETAEAMTEYILGFFNKEREILEQKHNELTKYLKKQETFSLERDTYLFCSFKEEKECHHD